MNRLAMAVVTLIGLAATTNLAVARDGCGRGLYWDGQACRPMGGPGYRGGYYGGYESPTAHVCNPGWSLQDGVCKPYRGPVGYGGGYYRGYGYNNSCRPGWSLQDGVCKPYRGP
jgi:hypothetical protein